MSKRKIKLFFRCLFFFLSLFKLIKDMKTIHTNKWKKKKKKCNTFLLLLQSIYKRFIRKEVYFLLILHQVFIFFWNNFVPNDSVSKIAGIICRIRSWVILLRRLSMFNSILVQILGSVNSTYKIRDLTHKKGIHSRNLKKMSILVFQHTK